MASIRNRIKNLSAAIDTLGNGGPIWCPDPEIVEYVEVVVEGRIKIPPLTPEEHEAIEKELNEIAKNYRMPVKNQPVSK